MVVAVDAVLGKGYCWAWAHRPVSCTAAARDCESVRALRRLFFPLLKQQAAGNTAYVDVGAALDEVLQHLQLAHVGRIVNGAASGRQLLVGREFLQRPRVGGGGREGGREGGEGGWR